MLNNISGLNLEIIDDLLLLSIFEYIIILSFKNIACCRLLTQKCKFLGKHILVDNLVDFTTFLFDIVKSKVEEKIYRMLISSFTDI